MTHNSLYYFYIGFILTEPCTKGMSKGMTRKVRKNNRSSSFFLCFNYFLCVVVTRQTIVPTYCTHTADSFQQSPYRIYYSVLFDTARFFLYSHG